MKKSGVKLWLAWTLVTAIGTTLGFGISAILGPLFFWDEFGGFYVPVILVVVGYLIGLGQWIILRKMFETAWAWILATTICLPTGIFIGFYGLATNMPALGNFLDPVHDYIISGCFAGLLIGVFQWLSLGTNKFSGMFTWILISGLSWGIGIALPGFIGNYVPESIVSSYGLWIWVIFGMFIGVLVGAISGIFVKTCIFDQTLSKIDSNL